jgi:hypothetical protein
MARTVARSPLPPATRGRFRSLARRTAIAGSVVAALAVVPAGATAASSVTITAPPLEGPLPTKGQTVKIAVQNVSKRKLSGLSINVRPVKGVRVTVAGAKKGTTTRRLSTLKAGKTTRVSVRLQRLKGGPKVGAVTARVLRGKRTAASQRVQFGINPNTLAGRYFWGSTFTLNGTRMETLYFSNDNLVFTDDMEGAYANCTVADEKCRPYQYVAKGNQLQIDGKPAVLNGRKLEYDGQSYLEFAAPPAGTRFDANLTYVNTSGICPLYCNYFREDLRFFADGKLIRGAVISGTGPVVDYGIVPPDSLATYEVRADGTIRMLFGDGKERIETIAFYLADNGTLQSPSDGVVLNGDGYFDISKKD